MSSSIAKSIERQDKGVDPVDEGRKNPPQTEFGKPKSKAQEQREGAELLSNESRFQGDKSGGPHDPEKIKSAEPGQDVRPHGGD